MLLKMIKITKSRIKVINNIQKFDNTTKSLSYNLISRLTDNTFSKIYNTKNFLVYP
jgi:hypothetical protein